jgi:hypothetical protein
MAKVMKVGFNVFSEADVEVLLEVLARRFENHGELLKTQEPKHPIAN